MLENKAYANNYYFSVYSILFAYVSRVPIIQSPLYYHAVRFVVCAGVYLVAHVLSKRKMNHAAQTNIFIAVS